VSPFRAAPWREHKPHDNSACHVTLQNPSINKSEWTPAEDEIIIKAHKVSVVYAHLVSLF
jgi:hypothetical protein